MKKKLIAPMLAAALIVSNGIMALAAPEVINVNGTNTVFDYEYYASANPDVAAAFGKNRELLIQHYIACGKSENRAAYAPGTDVNALLSQTSSTNAATSKRTETKILDDYGNTEVIEYDENGRITTSTNYTGKGIPNFQDQYTYTYYENGSLQTSTRVTVALQDNYYARAGEITRKYIEEYDAQGKLVKSTDDKSTSVVADIRYYYYDDQGRLIHEQLFSSSGNLRYSYYYVYDGNGNEINRKTVKDGKIVTEFNSTYDSQNRLIKEVGYSTTFGLRRITDITYDEKGNPTKNSYEEPY